jgi:hypothetical protein
MIPSVGLQVQLRNAMPSHIGTYGRTATLWKLCNLWGLPVLTKDQCVPEILAPERKTAGKTGGDDQYGNYQYDGYEWVHRDGGGGSGSDVVDLTRHAKHDDAWQRRHLSGITPIRHPAPETISGSPIAAHMRA